MVKLAKAIPLFALVSADVFAASGWYLMIPPSSYDEKADYLSKYKVLDTEPLSKWTQQAAFDTAAECEEAKSTQVMLEHNLYAQYSTAYIKAISTEKDAAILNHMKFVAESSNAKVDAANAARCIKSDDPRLAK